MGKAKPDVNELRRTIGYYMVTFLSVFIYLPILWFIHLFTQNNGLYLRWVICSIVLVVFNILFYYWKYPEDWLKNLLSLVGINLLILVFEYFWLLQSMG